MTCSWQDGAEQACHDALRAGPGSAPEALLMVAQVHALIAIGRRLGELAQMMADAPSLEVDG
jgi:hypothetical protein